MTGIGRAVFRGLSSLRLAVFLLVALTVALIVATCLESLYDTPTGQYFVYRTFWFRGLLALLGLNILVVALSRWPWKRHHSAFLLAHAGILMLLFGAWITEQWGIDGVMRLEEGRTSTVVEIDRPLLTLTDGRDVKQVAIPWLPPGTSFRPISVRDYGIEVDRFLSHADPAISFVPVAQPSALPAAKIRIQGGPMRINQSFWLWAGDPGFSRVQAGPARLEISGPGLDRLGESSPAPGPRLRLSPEGAGVRFESSNSSGEVRRGKALLGKPIEAGWRGGVQLALEEWIPSAQAQVDYTASKVEYGQGAPPSAIRLKAANSEIWLGLGDRATLSIQGREVGITYAPQRLVLPFGLHLDRFRLEFYDGTRSPKVYASDVKVEDASAETQALVVSMNEPLERGGLTFYQSSYEPAEPRPVVSILSVNRDPGRALKYLGSLLLVLGCIQLFVSRLKKKRTPSGVQTGEVSA